MGAGYRILTDELAEQFIDRGYILLHDCFTPGAAAKYTETIWTRLGYDPNDPSTWDQAYVHLPEHRRLDVKQFAPKVWDAVCDLLGGEERIAQPYKWGDGFIVNLSQGSDRPWEPASASSPGWHKDGDFFRHFLDSPEQGLLTLVLWTEVVHQGGATFVASDSLGPVARYLAERPEGVLPGGFDIHGLIGQCSEFVEATGRIGDVYLLHPYMLHTKAQNVLCRPRAITNPPIRLREPMQFERNDPSLVEQAVLRGLGTDRYEFVATAPRQEVVPERVRLQQEMKNAAETRMAAAGGRVFRRDRGSETGHSDGNPDLGYAGGDAGLRTSIIGTNELPPITLDRPGERR